MVNKLKYVFGPVPSRRLGKSLGVDLVPRKMCTFDCVYCQVGRTTCKTLIRKPYVPMERILEEVEVALRRGPRPDYVTLSGSGEPTLNTQIGTVIRRIKRMTDVPVVVLTNGSLFYDPAVREDCRAADLILPSLDAGDEETFQAVNRPAEGLTLEKVVAGMERFRAEYEGPIWLEVFVVEGVNSSPEQVRRIGALAERIRPDRIQVNTAVRPTAEQGVRPLSSERLEELCALLGPDAEVIADFRPTAEEAGFAATADAILDMISRRPCTLDDVAAGLNIHVSEAVKYVAAFLNEGTLRKERRAGKDFLVLAREPKPSIPPGPAAPPPRSHRPG